MKTVNRKTIYHFGILKILFFSFFTYPVTTLQAEPITPVQTMQVPAITEIPEIDGLKNESFWSSTQSLYAEYFWGASQGWYWDGPSDFSCTFNAAWGHSCLYLFIEITDDIEDNWNGTDGYGWEFDNIQVYFQLDTNTVENYYDSTATDIMFCRGKSQWQMWPGRAEPDEFISYAANTEHGWVLETAIPWTCALPEGGNPEEILNYLPVIGFDLWANDSDNADGAEDTGSRETSLTWDPDEICGDDPRGNCDIIEIIWNNTSIFGYMTLTGTPETGLPSNNNINHSFQVFPNPASEVIHVFSASGVLELLFYNASGMLVKQISGYQAGNEIDISSLHPGLYYIRTSKDFYTTFVKN